MIVGLRGDKLPGRVSGGIGLLVTARLGLVADGRTAPHGTTRRQHPVALHGVALGDSRLARTHPVRSPHYKISTHSQNASMFLASTRYIFDNRKKAWIKCC